MGRPLKVEKGDAPFKAVVFSLGLLLPVGLDFDSSPAVEGLDSWDWSGELLRSGAVTDAPRPLETDEKADGIRKPVFDGFGNIGNVGARCIVGCSAGEI